MSGILTSWMSRISKDLFVLINRLFLFQSYQESDYGYQREQSMQEFVKTRLLLLFLFDTIITPMYFNWYENVFIF